MIDFHCHLDLCENPDAVRLECETAGIAILSVTTTPSAWTGTLRLAQGSTSVVTALGLHPQLALERSFELDLFDSLLPSVLVVGEIGLDYSPGSDNSWTEQRRVFAHIVRACERANGRVMSIHSRRAMGDVLDVLQKHPGAGIPVLHWPTCSKADLKRAITLGCWFSVGPTMLRTAKGKMLAAMIPRNRLITETDSPFAAIDGRRASPLDVSLAIPLLAEIWSLSPGEVEKQVSDNAALLLAAKER